MRHTLSRRPLLTALVAAVFTSQALAEPVRPRGDDYGDAFVNYLPYVVPGEPKEPAGPASAPSAAPAAARANAKAEGPQTASVEFLRKMYPKLEERAIDNPTRENVSDYMYAKRVVMDKAQRFSEMVTKVVREDPLLDENNRVPYASTGALSVRNANYQAQQKAVQELARVGGLVIFVDSTCRFCAMQLPVLGMLKNGYNLEYVVISLDGSKPRDFKGAVIKDNGLFNKLGLKLTPSIVYVPKPQGYAGDTDPNRYLVVAQGFYAQDELVKQIAYAGHNTKLLSAAVMRDLDVWDRGVVSTTDLQQLKLDPNRPGSFREALQPYLLKQY
ncbi:conjugal transfer protein TraF [Ralstonia pseudosolanacearum]|uniref:Conjugal transfer protein n=1 Tax=Ralstonia pseudosolanacearum TaxID=1310165 RepID=A0A454TLQ0_9RALS|nr:conjugal transfer protein TraF [Ralstonia pseudosolanacearum]RNM03040.1 conjugal transfer protein [Ralstonia pseudosolanacearum]